MPLVNPALPYGMRDIKLTPYTDDTLTVLGTPVNLPNSRTLSFSESEEFTELRGDDKLVAIHGAGPQIEWELEAGGLSLEAYKVMAGGTLATTGVTPNQIKNFTKKVTDQRPYFHIEGKAISDSGGDVRCIIYRARVNDTLEGEFTDSEFFLTSGSGLGLPSLVPATVDNLYTFLHNETADITT